MDFDAYLGAVTRSVHDVQRDGRPARNVTLERAYDTTPDDLWDAITSPERLRRWFLPISGDLRLGGRYQFTGNAGGTITGCEPPHRLAATWEFGGGVSWVEVRIDADGPARSRLRLSHTCPIDDHWRKYGPGAVGVGWDLGLVGLALHIADPSLEKFDEDAFAAMPEAKVFIAGLSDDWRRAAVAAGEDPAVAEAAAKLTTGFYTGEAAPGN